MLTLVESVEGDNQHFEVAVDGHLLADVLAEGGLAGSRPPRDADQDPAHVGILTQLPHSQIFNIG